MPTLGIEEDETAVTFVINKEDHTLGNSLRYMIMKNPDTQFCGYSIPHPSEEKINFRFKLKSSINEHKRRNQSAGIENMDQS